MKNPPCALFEQPIFFSSLLLNFDIGSIFSQLLYLSKHIINVDKIIKKIDNYNSFCFSLFTVLLFSQCAKPSKNI